MQKKLLLLGVVFCAIVWGQVSWGARELTMSIPPGWVPSQPASPVQKLRALLVDEQGVARAELVFAIEPAPQGFDLEGYFNALNQSLQTFFQSYTSEEVTPFVVSGVSGLRHKFLFRVQGNPNELQGLAFLFLLEGQVYTLSFGCLAADFPRFEGQFLQIAQGLTVTEGTVSGPLLWTHQDPQHAFTVPLPQGASVTEELENGAVYATPNEGQVVILKLENEAAVQGIVSQVVQGKNLHGTTTLHTATGHPVQVALYSSVNPDTSVQYATLVGTFPGTALLVLVVLPASEYEKAQNWIGTLFTQAEIR